SDHDDHVEEPSIVRRRASSRPRGGGRLWLVVLLLLVLALWLTFTRDPNPGRPREQEGPDVWRSLFIALVSVALLAGVFWMVYAWSRAKKKSIHPHWYLTAIAAACAFTGVVLWLVRQDLSGILLLIVAVAMAFGFHILSPFWYHLRTGGYLT